VAQQNEQEQSCTSHSSPSELDNVGADSKSDTNLPHTWDPDAGLKPLELDNDVSANIEMEADLPPGADEELSSEMVDIMFDLEGCDEQDMEWLPLKERRKREARKIGMISSALTQKYRDNLLAYREKKDSLAWPQCHCKISVIAKMPATCSGNEESDQTHQFFGTSVLIPLVPTILNCKIHIHILIASHIQAHVEGTICGTISCTINRPIASSLSPTFIMWSITCGIE
jgi:hypothetical protein